MRAQALFDQMVMDGGRGEERGDGRVVTVGLPVGENEDIRPLLDNLGSVDAEFLEGLLKGVIPSIRRKDGGQDNGLEVGPCRGFDPGQVVIGQNRVREFEFAAMLGALVQQVPVATDKAREGHHETFSDWVDRRIGDLGKKLFEIIEEQLRLIGEDSERGIGSHRADRFLPVTGHRAQDVFDLFIAVPVQDLLGAQEFLVGSG
ncbi:MAG TPA: hypothetical protein PLD82_10015 [Spirochaetota bacterium]|nr:hypothetical protein [Spirochaetota bacterium]